VANRVILDFQDSVAKLVAKVATAVTLDIRAILDTVAKLVPAVILANRGSVDILANQDSADLVCLDILDLVATLDQAFRDFLDSVVPKAHRVFLDLVATLDQDLVDILANQDSADLAYLVILDSVAILDQAFRDSQDSVVPKAHRVFLAIQDSAVLAHQDILANQDLVDILANQDSADLVSVDILAIQVPRGYQDLVAFLDIVAKSVPVDLVDSAVLLAQLVHQAHRDTVAILDQAFRGIAVFLATLANKVHRSILKAQWPIQLPCHRLETIPMMPTLSIPMVIYTFGLALHGIMLAK